MHNSHKPSQKKYADNSFTKRKQATIFLMILILGTGLDQLTKFLASTHLKGKAGYKIIPNIFELLYVENRGAAFGLLNGKYTVFFVVAVIVSIAILYLLYRLPCETKYLPLLLSASMIFTGAAGNMIDRLTHRYVVDFIYFVPINFPVFNVADIYVTVSTAGLAILLLTVYKDNDFSFLKRRK